MKKSKIVLRKVLILILSSIIPLVSAFFVGKYSYNRYLPLYFNEYMAKGEEDTVKKIEKYLSFLTYSYDENVYHEEVVMLDEEVVLRFRIYRFVTEHTRYNNLAKPYLAYELNYAFVAYDINYQKLIEIQHPDGDHLLEYNNLPTIYINLQDEYYDGNSLDLTMGIPTHPQDDNSIVLIKDYNSSPEKDYKGKELNSRYIKYTDTTLSSLFTDNITVEVFMTDSLIKDDQTYKSTILTISKDDFYQTTSQVDITSYTMGSDGDSIAAGYFAHVFKTRIWWQSLIALALMSFITFSFYIVWKAEEYPHKTKKEGKK